MCLHILFGCMCLYLCRESFDEHILGPLQRDVIKYTWLHERYSCQGTQATQRTAAYFEFPSVVAMLTRCVRRRCK